MPAKANRDTEFAYDVFLSHSSKDKGVIRPLAEHLRADGLRVWFDEWEIKPGDNIPAKIEAGLEHSRVLVLCMSANAFGSDWAQLEAGTFRFRDPLNKDRRFVPLRLDDAPIKGSLAQFHYINWLPVVGEQEYTKLRDACWSLEEQPRASEMLPESGRANAETLGGEASQPGIVSGCVSNGGGSDAAVRQAVDREVLPRRAPDSRWTSSSDFFADRFAKAFPGLRNEVRWFTDTEEIARRLDRLLHPLLVGCHSPIWWFRGHSNNAIKHFRRLDNVTWLLDNNELQLTRIAAVGSKAYWNPFVYLEAKGVVPSGAYPHAKDAPEDIVKRDGYLSEELCLFRGRYLKREFYDDGAAEIDGQLVDIDGEAEIRVRYLSKYNLLIAANDSSINNTQFDERFQHLMNDIIVQPEGFERLVHEIRELPKQVRYWDSNA